MRRWIVAAAIPMVFGIALAACSDSANDTSFGNDGPCLDKTPPSVQDDVEMSVEELVDLVAEALTCPGYVAHLRSQAEVNISGFRVVSETEYWIDIPQNRGRSEKRLLGFEATSAEAQQAMDERDEPFELPETPGVEIVSGGARYVTSFEGEADTAELPPCPGSDRGVLGLLFDCFQLDSADRVTVEIDTDHEGIPAVALRVQDGLSDATLTVLFDRRTFLPLAALISVPEMSGVFPFPESDLSVEFDEMTFVASESLDAVLFDPASIGYVEPDPIAELDAIDAPVYWLGESIQGSPGFPTFTLSSVSASPEETRHVTTALISYQSASTDAPQSLTLTVLPPAGFVAIPPADPCSQRREVDLPDRSAILYGVPDLSITGHFSQEEPCPPPATFYAEVFFEDAVVKISGLGLEPGPYNSEAGMELLIRSLELRE